MKRTALETQIASGLTRDSEDQCLVFEFANYQAEIGQGVTRNGVAVPLAPKELSVLKALLRRSGKLTSKSELLDEVWPNQTIGEESLTRCIYILRSRLPVEGAASIIETVHRRGYRISVPVTKKRSRTAERRRLHSPDTSSPAAYAAYLEGRQHARQMTLDSYPVAIRYFEEALQHDREYAHALAAIADCRIAQLFFRDPTTDVHLAAQACEEALALDADLALAHAALGWIEGVVYRKTEVGLARLTHALQLDPQCAQSYNLRAWVLCGLGRNTEAIEDQRRAGILDPYMPLFQIGVAHSQFLGGRAEEALSQFRRLGMLPELPNRYRVMALGFHCMVAGYLGRSLEAISAAESLTAAQLASPDLRTFVAYSLARCGRKNEAELLVNTLKCDRLTPSLMPALHVALGDKRAAHGWIDAAVETHCPSLLTSVHDPRLQTLGLRPQSFIRY